MLRIKVYDVLKNQSICLGSGQVDAIYHGTSQLRMLQLHNQHVRLCHRSVATVVDQLLCRKCRLLCLTLPNRTLCLTKK